MIQASCLLSRYNPAKCSKCAKTYIRLFPFQYFILASATCSYETLKGAMPCHPSKPSSCRMVVLCVCLLVGGATCPGKGGRGNPSRGARGPLRPVCRHSRVMGENQPSRQLEMSVGVFWKERSGRGTTRNRRRGERGEKEKRKEERN